MKNIVAMIVMLFMLNAASWAQSVSVAQINGTAKDQSGALLPGVDVKVTQTETGLSRSTLTDETGTYRLSNLPVGPYRLEVSLAGFKTYVQTGIVLQVSTNPTVNVVLEIGAVSDSIEVKADAAMVETRSDGVGTVVDERRIAELPLNGRQVTQLIQLSGAAVPTGAMGASRVYPSAIGVAIAGAIPNSTNYVLDGGYHNDYNTNVGLPLPMPDALQEFKVETSALPARYGVHPGGTVNAVTKSGTNEFHGTAFEFVRNNAFNAKNPFALTDDGLKRNQFGGTLGGPISQNRLFFFGGFQETLVRVRPTTTQTFVPTQAMLNGDFTTIASAACNGGRATTLGAPFVNNQLDPSQFDKFAVKVLKYIPVSSDPCGRITYGQRGDYDELQAIGRIDYQRSDKHSIFGRYYLAHYNHPVQFDGTNLLLAAGNSTGLGFDSKAQAFVIGDTYTFNPSLISAFRGTVNRVASVRDAGNQLFTYQDLGANVTALYKGDHRNFFPLTITNGFGGSGFPGFFMTNGFQLAQDFDLVRGAHQIAFGVNWIHPQHNGQTAFPMDGGLTFNGSRSGGNRIGMADFFAGLPSEFRQAQSIVYDRLNYVGAYVQDSWRISPRFIANAGVRWEPYFPAHNIENKVHHFEQSWFLEGRRSTAFTNSPPGYLYPGDAGYPGQSNTSQRLAQFGPRLGFVIDPTGDGRQTIRLSYGILYDNPIMWETSHFPLDPPWGNYVIITNPPSSQNPWSTYPGGNPFPTPNPLPKDFAFPLFATYTNLPLNAKPMHMEQWSLNYQRQFGASWLASASYLGNRSVHMWLGVDVNHATYIPGQSTTANTNLRRKLYLLNPTTGQYYADILQMDDGANANYNGMLLSLQKRFSGNLSWNTNYTWSKCMNDGEAGQDITNQYPDPDNRRSNHGRCSLDRASIINSSLLLQTPKAGSALMRRITGDWQLSTIFTFQTGDPLTVTSPGDLALIGTAGQRAIQIGDPQVDNPTIDRWFNTAAFTPNTPGVWGNVGRNTLRGPKVWNLDSSLSRRFQVNEKQRIELRAEAFNIFNHFNPGDPTTAINSANFGRITSAAREPRILQFALKYGF